MILGDEIRNHRIQAEKDAGLYPQDGNYLEARAGLALWVIAEQLFELRSLISISLESRKP